MKIRKLTKEELGEKVLFPRTQLKGLTCENKDDMPEKHDFVVTIVHDVPGMGSVWMATQAQAPHMKFQIILTDSEQQFDDFLGKLLGMHDVPSYIEGRTDFMVLFVGSKDGQEINQKNHKEVYRRICHMQDQAARWWHLYVNLNKV